jgi:uncharacterized membrane protein
MNFPAALFSDEWAYGAFVPLAVVWLWCLRTAPWRRIADSGQLNVWLGSIVVLMATWRMNAGVQPGLNLHLLGATAFTLMFGRQLAIVGLSLVLAAVMANAGGLDSLAAWQPYALNALVMAVFPCFAAYALLRCTERCLPVHLFVYLFFPAFFGAALVTLATGLVAIVLLWAADVYPVAMLFDEYFPPFMLLGFAEAWLNGAAITLMVVYAPHWVGSFDDRRYLMNK